MGAAYVELHAKSFYSFGLGASHVHELLTQAKAHGCHALSLTDTNLCGALEFARLANSLDIQPITGGELVLQDDSRLTLLARTRQGYANLSRLFTLASAVDRRQPRLDPAHLPEHAEGVVLLCGGRGGRLSHLMRDGRRQEAERLLRDYLSWYGSGSVYVELQQNFLNGDTARNRELSRLAREQNVPLIASNDAHYHIPKRYRLQNALVAARHNVTIDQALPLINPNPHLSLKSPAQMTELFSDCPEALANAVRVAESCTFNLSTDLGYALPEPDVPMGYTPQRYLRQLCIEAAIRRYGAITPHIEARLDEEMRLVQRHHLAGFLLLYREIVLIAQQVMQERGLAPPETPLEERAPGRGRGSSVSLLVGYLIGISHVDPIKWNLTLERFISEEMTSLPDIDLDFPRGLRETLIERVHSHFGPHFAVLTGAIHTYTVKGIIQDLGKALGLPRQALSQLSKQLNSRDAADLRREMLALDAFCDRVDAPGWHHLLQLAPQLMDAPRLLSQHVGGMVLSSSPIPEMVPVRAGATQGRFIMDWDKDSVADANFAKIDLLSLPVLDQLDEAVDLIEAKEGRRPDLSRIDPDDPEVYDLINEGRAKGVFLLQSPAQLKMGQRLKSRNLLDLAYQVALIRPGVGTQGSAVSNFVARYRHGAAWDYDHPLEKRALERGYGIIVWQEQVVQLVMDVAGMSAAEADEIRRAFAKPNNQHLIAAHRQRFLAQALQRGVPLEIGEKIFGKINGHYMFPESHSFAFGITAYQAAWMKCHYPLEFFVALINNQPMGFYPLETLKQDARRFGVAFRNPCVNLSQADSAPEAGALRLGLRFVKDVGKGGAALIAEERRRGGNYASPGDLVRRTGIKEQAVRSLVRAGAFDGLNPNRRAALWEAGLAVRPSHQGQVGLALRTEDRADGLTDFTDYEKMAGEYRVMGMYPRGHLMEFIRPRLSEQVLPTVAVEGLKEGKEVQMAGWPVARQHPKGKHGVVFVTIEDEYGDQQVTLWADVAERCRRQLRSQVVLITGVVSR
ncbi:MAG: DNA polymerase III subunit alpha, partial [Candidatus Tectomicrobia bacterium]|nr:DNA polymerase III subunit alpha [Candidatus Tectomicrobia bacterium]